MFVVEMGQYHRKNRAEEMEIYQFELDVPRRQVFADTLMDLLINWRNDLRSFFPVYFVAIVILGIVRCCDHHSRRQLKISHGKCDNRCCNCIFKVIDFDSGLYEGSGGQASKAVRFSEIKDEMREIVEIRDERNSNIPIRVVPGVPSDGNSYRLSRRVEQSCDSLSEVAL